MRYSCILAAGLILNSIAIPVAVAVQQAKTPIPVHRTMPAHTAASASSAASNPDYAGFLKDTFTWPASKMPLKVFIHAGTGVAGFKPSFDSILKRSFEEWGEASDGKISFQFVDKASDADIDLEWKRNLSSGAVAHEIGVTHWDRTNGQVTHARTTLLTVNVDGHEMKDFNVKQASLHEIGHILGINGHSPTFPDIMTLNYRFVINRNPDGSETLVGGEPRLTSRDKNTLLHLYSSSWQSASAAAAGTPAVAAGTTNGAGSGSGSGASSSSSSGASASAVSTGTSGGTTPSPSSDTSGNATFHFLSPAELAAPPPPPPPAPPPPAQAAVAPATSAAATGSGAQSATPPSPPKPIAPLVSESALDDLLNGRARSSGPASPNAVASAQLPGSSPSGGASNPAPAGTGVAAQQQPPAQPASQNGPYVQLVRTGIDSIKRGEFDRAIASLDHAKQMGGDSSHAAEKNLIVALTWKGNQLYSAKDYASAADCYKSALSLRMQINGKGDAKINETLPAFLFCLRKIGRNDEAERWQAALR